MIEQPRHENNLKTELQAGRITDLTLADIHHLTIERAGELLEFTRIGDQWRLDAPVEDLAARSSVNSLITSVVGARIERSLPVEGEDLSSYDLADPPAAVVRLATVSGDTVLAIRLGSHSITKAHCYARMEDGGDILLLPAGLRRYALLELPGYRDDKVVRFKIEAVQSFELASTGNAVQWHRNGRGGWDTIVRGDTITGDTDELEAILHRLRGLRVRKFISDDPAETGRYFSEGSPALTMWFEDKEATEKIWFEPFNRDSCYAKKDRNTRLVLTDNPILAAFEKTIDDLRNRRLLHFDRAAIGRIRYLTADTTATIVKTARKWAYDNPALGTIEHVKTEPLLSALENLKLSRVVAEEVVDKAAHGFDAPFMVITVWDPEGNVIDRLRCGAEAPGSSRYVTSRSSSLLAEIDLDQLADITAAFRNLRVK